MDEIISKETKENIIKRIEELSSHNPDWHFRLRGYLPNNDGATIYFDVSDGLKVGGFSIIADKIGIKNIGCVEWYYEHTNSKPNLNGREIHENEVKALREFADKMDCEKKAIQKQPEIKQSNPIRLDNKLPEIHNQLDEFSESERRSMRGRHFAISYE